MFSQTCRNIRLHSYDAGDYGYKEKDCDIYYLEAECLSDDGSYRESLFYPRQWLHNADGTFTPFRDYKSLKGARKSFLKGATLHSDLRAVDGRWLHAEVDLDSLIANVDGRLVPYCQTLPCWICLPRFLGHLTLSRVCLRGPALNTKCKFCVVCSTLAEAIWPWEISPRDGNWQNVNGAPDLVIQYSKDCSLLMSHGGMVDTASYMVHVPADVQDEHAFFQRSRRPNSGPSMSLEQAAAQIQVWLGDCLNFHNKCDSRKEGPLPTRILDISHITDFGNLEVKLTEPRDKMARYVCLSYCWGTVLPLRLTSQSRSRFQAGIPWNDLPMTFQHALRLCWTLGIRYLWIDALCIIQDSVKDWESESVKMAAYYGNSFLCLASAQGKDSTAALRPPEAPLNAREITVQTSDGANSQLFTVQVCRAANDVFHEDLQAQGRPPLTCPLYTRAWAFQEWLLSERVVHFCPSEMVFECFGGTFCECGHAKDKSRIQLQSPGSLVQIMNHTKAESADSYGYWKDIVKRYSALQLTYATDRLPALSGLASAYAARSEEAHRPLGQYLAGLWEATLLNDLAWWIDRKGSLKARPSQYVAPTWSWAAVAASSTIASFGLDRGAHALCDVIFAETDIRDLGQYSRVTSGTLTIEGQPLAVSWSQTIASPGTPNCTGWVFPIQATSTSCAHTSLISRQQIIFDYDIKAPGPHQLSSDDYLYVVPLRYQTEHNGSKQICCLVLRRLRDECYERVGFVHSLQPEGYLYREVECAPRKMLEII